MWKQKKRIFDYTSGLAVDEDGVLRADKYIVEHFPEAINTYLSKNFSFYKIIKFVYGFGVWGYGGDNMTYDLLFKPVALSAFGVPYNIRGIYYHIFANCAIGFAVTPEGIDISGLPDSIIEELKSSRFGEVLVFPGNGISFIASPLEGVKKDIEYGLEHRYDPNLKYIEMYLPVRSMKVYLFRAGIKGRKW